MSRENQARIGTAVAVNLHAECRASRNASSIRENVRVLLRGEKRIRPCWDRYGSVALHQFSAELPRSGRVAETDIVPGENRTQDTLQNDLFQLDWEKRIRTIWDSCRSIDGPQANGKHQESRYSCATNPVPDNARTVPLSSLNSAANRPLDRVNQDILLSPKARY